MKTILVLAEHPELGEAIRTVLNAEQYRVLHRPNLGEAEPFLAAGLLDACIVDIDLLDVRGNWLLESLFRHARRFPVLVYTSNRNLEWEEEAYLKGVAFVLPKPVRGRLLNAVLERLFKKEPPRSAAPTPVSPPPSAAPLEAVRPFEALPRSAEALHVLRDFSGIMTHSLEAEPMLRQFLLTIREIVGVNRAAIFLRHPVALFSGAPPEQGRYMRSACAVGLPPGLLEHFELSFDAGIGGYLFQQGRILRRQSPEVLADPDMQKEFELLGAQVAIPILDRETLIGVAALDGRITGEALSNSELALIFHLLEELGLAVKNIWLHNQLSANHDMLAEILRELSSACVVVNRELVILHANKRARQFFAPAGRSGLELTFADLPAMLGSKIYQVLQNGTAVVPFKYQPPDQQSTIYQVTVVPFHKTASALPGSALMMVEDLTQAEQFKRLEVEAGNLRMVRTMAERLAHEINNAVMPISTIFQVIKKEKDTSLKDPSTLELFTNTLGDGVKRISRRGAQMRILAQDGLVSKDVVQFTPLLQEAYEEAQKHHTAGSAKLNLAGTNKLLMVLGDKESLKLALMEVFLNALQAPAKDPKVVLRLQTEIAADNTAWLHLEIQDNGPGFTPEALVKGCEPFYRTKVIGLGLGLTVAQKVVKLHEGKLALSNATEGTGAIVRISLPLDASSTLK